MDMRLQNQALLLIAAAAGLLVITGYLSETQISKTTGMVVSGAVAHKDMLDENYTSETVIPVETDLKAEKISIEGKAFGGKSVEITLIEHDSEKTILDEECLIEDNSKKKELLDQITHIPPVNNSREDPQINTILEYNNGTRWDEDDDGFAERKDAVDFTVKNTNITFTPVSERLCTIWEHYSLDNGKTRKSCYGGRECCNLYDLTPAEASSWSDTYYLNIGLSQGGRKNLVSAKVAYADINLELENASIQVYHGDWETLPAFFYTPEYLFTHDCTQTPFDTPAGNKSLRIRIAEGEKLHLHEINIDGLKTVEVEEEGMDVGELEIWLWDKEGKINGEYYIQDDDGEYSITLQTILDGGTATYSIHGIQDSPGKMQVKADYLEDEFFKTPVFAFKKTLNLTKAEIVVPVTGHVNTLAKCMDFNWTVFKCNRWKTTELADTLNETHIKLTVPNSMVYSVGYTNLPSKQESAGLKSIRYIGPNRFTLTQDKQRMISLSRYFTSDEGLRFIAGEAEGVDAVIDSNILVLTPTPGFTGKTSLTVTAIAGETSLEKQLTVTVGKSQPPLQVKPIPNLAWNSAIFTQEDIKKASKTINLSKYFKDPEEDELSYALGNNVAGFNLEINGETLNITLTRDYEKMQELTIKVADTGNEIESNTFTLAVWETHEGDIPGLKKLV